MQCFCSGVSPCHSGVCDMVRHPLIAPCDMGDTLNRKQIVDRIFFFYYRKHRGNFLFAAGEKKCRRPKPAENLFFILVIENIGICFSLLFFFICIKKKEKISRYALDFWFTVIKESRICFLVLSYF